MNKLNPINPVTGDYLGKLVKKFESGSKGCTTISQCGNDWGYSFGSYQLTARWGNALAFFREYYGTKYAAQLASVQYYGPDFVSKTDPGLPYCVGMNILAQLWALEASTDPITMEANERKYIQKNYYEKCLKNLSNFNPNLYNRAFQECMWSWAVHKSGKSAAKYAMEVINSVNLETISAEELFDLFYDYRYNINSFTRYKKGITNGSSEREVLRPYLNQPPLLFNGISYQNSNTNANGTTTTTRDIYRVRLTWADKSTQKGAFYDLSLAKKCADANPGYSVFDSNGVSVYSLEKVQISSLPYLVRPQTTINVRSTPAIENNIVGSVNQQNVFTIVEESNGFGKLKSGVGWIKLSLCNKI